MSILLKASTVWNGAVWYNLCGAMLRLIGREQASDAQTLPFDCDLCLYLSSMVSISMLLFIEHFFRALVHVHSIYPGFESLATGFRCLPKHDQIASSAEDDKTNLPNKSFCSAICMHAEPIRTGINHTLPLNKLKIVGIYLNLYNRFHS